MKNLYLYILAMPFILISSSTHLHYRNIQCFIIAMPFNTILMLYVLLCTCILPYDFSKLTILFIHMYISVISMTNELVITFIYVKKIYVCLSVWHRIMMIIFSPVDDWSQHLNIYMYHI